MSRKRAGEEQKMSTLGGQYGVRSPHTDRHHTYLVPLIPSFGPRGTQCAWDRQCACLSSSVLRTFGEEGAAAGFASAHTRQDQSRWVGSSAIDKCDGTSSRRFRSQDPSEDWNRPLCQWWSHRHGALGGQKRPESTPRGTLRVGQARRRSARPIAEQTVAEVGNRHAWGNS